MTLRRKLLLVALATLALPLTGWFYVRQMETLLREGQSQALIATGSAIARSLVVTGAMDGVPPGEAWYVQRAPAPLVLDGYGDDWAPLTPWAQTLGNRARLLLGADAGGLALYLDVRNTRRTRADAEDPGALAADHVTLELENAQGRRRYLVASSAPGTSMARALDPPVPGLPDQLRAYWQEDGSGYRVALRLPAALVALGAGVHEARAGGARLAVERRPLLRASPALAAELGQLVPDGVAARVLSPAGWLLAAGGRLDRAALRSAQPGWFAALVYRSLLAGRVEPGQPWAREVPQLVTEAVHAAAAGTPVAAWREGETRGSVLLVASVPIERDGRVLGVLRLEQASRSVPLLANRALLGMLATSFGVLQIGRAHV